jgi:hypothetical protein
MALSAIVPVMLSAQGGSASNSQKTDKLAAKREVAQVRVNKAEADRRSADSLIDAGIALQRESEVERDEVLNEQAKLEDRVFKDEMPVIEKQIKSGSREEQAQGRAKKAEVRKSYQDGIKALRAQFTAAQKKEKEAKQMELRGHEKKRLADKALKDAVAALKAVEKEMEAFEDAEKTREREAQRMQKKKEEELAAKQKQKEDAELKKQKDKEAMLAKKEAEKAKSLQEKEKLKSKETAKREKEKEAQQKQKEKEMASREAEKAKKEKERAKKAESR